MCVLLGCVRTPTKYDRFHALHDSQIRSPSIKEFKEAYAFCNSVRSVIHSDERKRNKRNKKKTAMEQDIQLHKELNEEDTTTTNDTTDTIDIVIDVAGGHGGLGGLFLIMTSAQEAIIIDPAIVGQDGVTKAWKQDFFPTKTLRYKHECLRTALPNELQKYRDKNILVVGCHACQHLSEEIVSISCEYGVKYIAVMPCCQKDQTPGNVWKRTSKALTIPIEKLMDILLAGKVMGYRGCHSLPNDNNEDDSTTPSIDPVRPINYYYDVRMKTIDSNITPQNRIIICSYRSSDEDENKKSAGNGVHPDDKNDKINQAHDKLGRVYRKAHLCGACVVPTTTTTTTTTNNNNTSKNHDDDSSSNNNKYNKVKSNNNNIKMKKDSGHNHPNQLASTISTWRQYFAKQSHEHPAFCYITIGFVAGLFAANFIGGRSNNNYNPKKS